MKIVVRLRSRKGYLLYEEGGRVLIVDASFSFLDWR